MSTQKLTIFDTITRVRAQIQRNPNMKLVSSSEVGDLAEIAALKAVPVKEKTQVQWFWTADVIKAMDNFMAQQDRYRELQELSKSTGTEPTPLAPEPEAEEPVSVTELNEHAKTVIEPTTPEPGPEPDDTDVEPSAQAEVTEGHEGRPSLLGLGFDQGLVAALESNGIATVAALQNLVSTGGVEALEQLDGIGEARIKKIEKALDLTAEPA